MKLENLGKAKRITIDKDNTTIIDGAGEAGRSKAAWSESRYRLRRPPRTTTKRSSRNG